MLVMRQLGEVLPAVPLHSLSQQLAECSVDYQGMRPDIDFSALGTTASPKCPAWQSHNLPEEIQSALVSEGFQTLLGQSIIDFDTTAFPFREDLLAALLRRSSSAQGQQSQQRAAKKQRDQEKVTEFQDRLAALPLEKIHLAVNPAATPDDELHIPR
jgi:hypothetical protein